MAVVHPDDYGDVDRIMTKLLDASEPRNVSANRNYTRDGDAVRCEWYNSALLDDDGDVVSILSMVHDVPSREPIYLPFSAYSL